MEEKDKVKEVTCFENLFVTKFTPIPTVNSTVGIFSCFGIVFLVLGIVITSINAKIIEVGEGELLHYETTCGEIDYSRMNANYVYSSHKNYCTLNFELKEDMTAPIYFFYNLDNFYQNHRRYLKSKFAKQLAGETIKENKAKSDCYPISLNSDIMFTKAWDGETDLD